MRQRERREHTDGIEGDEAVDLCSGHHDQQRGREREGDDPVREHEAMPAFGELAGHEVVAGVEAREPGEIGEAGISGEHEDHHGARLQRVVHHVAERALAVDEFADL